MKPIKSELYSVTLIPDTINNKYIKVAKTDIPLLAPKNSLYITVKLLPLKYSRMWGNKYYKHVEVLRDDPSAKPQTLNIFQSKHPMIFDLITRELEDWKTDVKKEPLELRVAIPGKIVKVDLGQNVYRMTRNEKGELTPFTMETRDKETGHILKTKVITNSITMFLFREELQRAEEIIKTAKETTLQISAPVTITKDIHIDSLE